MADRNVKVVLSLLVSGFDAGARQAKASADSLAQSIEKTGEATAQAEKDAAKAGADAAKRAAEARSALESLSTVALTVGGVILAGVGVVTKAYADFDKQMSAVKATGQDAVANFDALRDAAIEAGASTAFSASEAAQGIEELAKAGLSAEDVLSGGLSGALDLAAAGTLSVGRAAEITAVTMRQFELAGEDATRVADLLAAGAGKSVGEVHDLAEALKMSGTVAHQYGVSIEETVGTLAMFAENALIGSDAGTSFKQMLLQLAQPTGKARDLLEQYNISAYDAQGNFVGMAELAAQLSSGLGHLSQEQQNAALKTIFGADAIRSATILMNQGEEGVRGWTAAVSEQGFAAEMARTKLDNLAGDLEALGGAFESAFIKSGSGVNDFLRGFTQLATGAVNAVGSLPGPVLALGTGLAGLAGAGLVVAGGLGHAVGTFIDLRANVKTLREEFPRLDSAMGKVGWKKALVGAAVLTAGLIALTAAQEANRRAFADLIVDADDLGAKLLRTADQGKALNEAFTLDTQGVFSGVTREVDGLGDALSRVLSPTAGQSFEDFFNGFLTGGSAAQQMRAQFQQLDQTLAGMVQGGNAEAASIIFDQIAAAAQEQGIEVSQLAPLFEAYSGALRNSAGASSAALTGAELLAGGLGEMADEGEASYDALVKLGSAMLSLSGSQMGFEASLDEATAAIKEHGKAVLDAAGQIDIGTEKGRALQGSLDGVASSALSVIDNMIKTGAASEDVAAFQQRAAGEFLATAGAMGLSTEAAADLAAKYGLIPQSVATAISAPGASLSREQVLDVTAALMAVPSLTNAQVLAPGARPSKAEVDALVKSVGTVPGLTTAQIRTIADLYGVEAAKSAIASVQGKSVTVTVNYQARGSTAQTRQASAYATGGPVYGPGTTTSDSILAMLSNREFVHTAAAHDYYGSRLMWAINERRIPKDWFAPLGFAGGGSPSSPAPVRYAPNYSPPAYASQSAQRSQPAPVVQHVTETVQVVMPNGRVLAETVREFDRSLR